MSIVTRFRKNLRSIGFKKTLEAVFGLLEDIRFDRKYGVDTMGWHELDANDVDSDNLIHAVDYQPTRVAAFRAMMRSLPLTSNSVFVDIGSGKGRLPLLASEFGFKRVVGIEFSNHLNRIAVENVDRYSEHRQIPCAIELINADITDYEPVHDENVFFLNNPFDAVVLEKFIQILSASIQHKERPVWLIFHRHWEILLDSEILENRFVKVQEFPHGSIIFEAYLSHPFASPPTIVSPS